MRKNRRSRFGRFSVTTFESDSLFVADMGALNSRGRFGPVESASALAGFKSISNSRLGLDQRRFAEPGLGWFPNRVRHRRSSRFLREEDPKLRGRRFREEC